MAWFWQKKAEDRAEGGAVLDDPILRALLGGGKVTRETAMQVPSVAGGINLIADIVAGTPIRLFRDEGGKAIEVTDDPRLRMLNDETGDTLNANEFWHAMIRDYYTGKGGYAYIRRNRGKFTGLFYVDERNVAIMKNIDPIFKDYDIQVNGASYKPFEFLKLLRNTRDGAVGIPITEENSALIEAAHAMLILERNMARRGGSKRGFLKAEKKLEQEPLNKLKSAFSKMYSGDSTESFVVLNSGIDFKEASDTAVELQLRENKEVNAEEFARILHVPQEAMMGKSGDTAAIAKLAAIPLMKAIECALNRDLLLEKEKGSLYWAFDTKELLKGSMKERFDAYKTALDANFMQVDEVRYAEDMEPLGLSWVKLGLQDVLYDPKTKTIYTPNTNQITQIEGQKAAAAAKKEEKPVED